MDTLPCIVRSAALYIPAIIVLFKANRSSITINQDLLKSEINKRITSSQMYLSWSGAAAIPKSILSYT